MADAQEAFCDGDVDHADISVKTELSAEFFIMECNVKDNDGSGGPGSDHSEEANIYVMGDVIDGHQLSLADDSRGNMAVDSGLVEESGCGGKSEIVCSHRVLLTQLPPDCQIVTSDGHLVTRCINTTAATIDGQHAVVLTHLPYSMGRYRS